LRDEESVRDWRLRVFERAADRLRLSGRLRTVAKHYFLCDQVKDVSRRAKMREGTLKRTLVALHACLRTRSRPEFLHAIYAAALGSPDIPPDIAEAIRK
jgi:hypothetical protein